MTNKLLFKKVKYSIIKKEDIMTNLKLKLGRQIKHLRKAQNLTQEQLAEIVNIDITSLSKIETGRNYPQPETIEKIANALNVELPKLFTFNQNLSKTDYMNKINQNLMFIKDNEEKLKIMYEISSALV